MRRIWRPLGSAHFDFFLAGACIGVALTSLRFAGVAGAATPTLSANFPGAVPTA